jgi:hypothetical protein
MRLTLCVFLCLLLSAIGLAQTGDRPPAECPQEINVNRDNPVTSVSLPPAKKCKTRKKNGFLLPDPTCTPGAVNDTLTLAVMEKPNFKTGCVRDQATSPEKKHDTYTWYKITKPANNTGKNQVCELDHLISLELGGADTLDNIWPQCGPSKAILNARFFKRKDAVENFLAGEVRNGKISLAEAQKRIAEDWTQFLDEAEACPKDDCSNP